MQSNRLAVVTGGGRGIGRAIAMRLAQDGNRVAVWARSADEIETVAREIRDAGGSAYAIQADVSDWSSIEDAVDRTREVAGRVDILVNNAAIAGPRGTVAEVSPREWARTIDIDLTGAFYCMRAVLPSMIERRSGKIVNLIGGGAGEAFPNSSAYAAAKTGLVRLTETAAQEMQSFNIQINAVTPGLVATRLSEEMARSLEAESPEDAARYREFLRTNAHPPEAGADLVAFLASPAADALTGRWLTVYDDWQELTKDPQRLMTEDLFVLRRQPR
jgi:NAD(P)-dependent dehydrogenase (short-subunit alcohol dehydrogenase family)